MRLLLDKNLSSSLVEKCGDSAVVNCHTVEEVHAFMSGEARTLINGQEAEDAHPLARIRQVVAEGVTVKALEISRLITHESASR